MQKLTDEEIIEAYKLHLKGSATACEDCPINDDDCERTLTNSVLELINRQKTEIEKLKKSIS